MSTFINTEQESDSESDTDDELKSDFENDSDNDKTLSLNRTIKTQFLSSISNELFCFSNKLLQITASIIKLHLHL